MGKIRGYFSNKKIIKSFMSMKLRNKLIIIFIVIFSVPVLLIESLSFNYLSYIMQSKVSTINPQLVNQTSKSIEYYIDSYQNALVELAMDSTMLENVKRLSGNNNLKRNEAENYIRLKMLSLKYTKSDIEAMTVLTDSTQLIEYYQNTLNIKYNITSLKEIYNDALNRDRVIIKSEILDGNVGKIGLIHIAVRIVDLNNLNAKNGVIILSLREELLQNMYLTNNLEDNSRNIHRTLLVVDKMNNIISAEQEKLIAKKIFVDSSGDLNYVDFLVNNNVLKNNDVIFNKVLQNSTGWTIISIIDANDLFRETNNLKILMIVISACIVIIVLVLIVLVSVGSTKSISNIINAMQKVRDGQILAKASTVEQNEMTIIAENFNEMMSRIQSLMESEKLHTQKTNEAIFRQKESEIKALEAQINPHFLYNTIDSINWIAIENNQNEISKMLKGLGYILRYSISDSNEIVSIQQDVEWLKQYMYLQMIRFYNKFTYSIDIDEEVKNYRIHKLLIQPIIENAIIHAFRNISAGGLIKIVIKKNNTQLLIYIEYNGTGMDEDKLSELNKLREIVKDMDYSKVPIGIGLSNIIGRIQLYYGNDGNIFFENILSGGTRVSVFIPITGL